MIFMLVTILALPRFTLSWLYWRFLQFDSAVTSLGLASSCLVLVSAYTKLNLLPHCSVPHRFELILAAYSWFLSEQSNLCALILYTNNQSIAYHLFGQSSKKEPLLAGNKLTG